MNTKANPLQQFYRKESAFIQLPSRGHYYNDDVVEFLENGELAVMPMTAADEITLKNPDALLSGKAIIDVISSCVSGVKKPKKLLACDIDALMIAIREASYGDEASMELDCPNTECKAKNEFALNLELLLNETETLDATYEVVLPNNLTVFLKPGSFDTTTRQNKAAFENAKIQRAMTNPSLTDEAQMALLAQVFKSLTKLNFEVIEAAIDKIVFTNEEDEVVEVTNKQQISEFIKNIDKSTVDLIDTKISDINKIGIAKTLDATCSNCGHKWEAPIEFNPVNFL
jgi:hypothetical protein